MHIDSNGIGAELSDVDDGWFGNRNNGKLELVEAILHDEGSLLLCCKQLSRNLHSYEKVR